MFSYFVYERRSMITSFALIQGIIRYNDRDIQWLAWTDFELTEPFQYRSDVCSLCHYITALSVNPSLWKTPFYTCNETSANSAFSKTIEPNACFYVTVLTFSVVVCWELVMLSCSRVRESFVYIYVDNTLGLFIFSRRNRIVLSESSCSETSYSKETRSSLISCTRVEVLMHKRSLNCSRDDSDLAADWCSVRR